MRGKRRGALCGRNHSEGGRVGEEIPIMSKLG